jgi:methyl-accepting chemotaxis protein
MIAGSLKKHIMQSAHGNTGRKKEKMPNTNDIKKEKSGTDEETIDTTDTNLPVAQDMRVATKLYGIIGFCLLITAMVASVSYWQFSLIGSEIEAIAERDIPVTNALTKITVHQLEQEISMERAFRYGEILKTDSHAGELFEKSRKKFEQYDVQINKELKETEALILTARDATSTAKERAVFQDAYDHTVNVDKAHKLYFTLTEEVFSLIKAGDLKSAHKQEEAIEKLVNSLNHEIEGLLLKFEGFTEHAAKTAEAHERTAIDLIATISIAGLLFSGIVSFLLIRLNIIRPLLGLVDNVETLASGDYDTEITQKANDEIGRVVRRLQTLQGNLIKAQLAEAKQVEAERKATEAEQKRLAVEQEATEKEMQLREQTAKEAEDRTNRLEEMISSFDAEVTTALEIVSAAAVEMHSSAQAMTDTAEQTSQRSSTVAAASEEASTNIQTVASAAEELSASVGEINRQVKESSLIAEKAVQEATATNEKVQGLADAAQKIGDVVNLINDIASQTNLLALNATIEAARAGDAGKGFAVVASEVKSLATQTGKATEEIGGQIHEIQEATGEAVQAIGGISDIISQINEISGAISSAVEEQGAASREIAGNVAQAATGTQEVSGKIVEVEQAASETGQTAALVLTAADELAKQGDALRGQVDQFLADIRAA